MSESVAIVESEPPPNQVVPDEPFDNADVKMFRADDKEAGTNICKMLVAFFFYSAMAMGFVTWWAFTAMKANNSDTPPAAVESHGTH